jgi:hypothetical protein
MLHGAPRWYTCGGPVRPGTQASAGTEIALHPHTFGPDGDAMSINGVITTKEVLCHGPTIVREFGAAAYLRCCVAILLKKRTTFLNCVSELDRE